MRHLFHISLFISLVCCGRTSAQPYKPVNISLSEGLSQSCVYSIVQDRQGFIWMATQDGLNRYDGVGFRVFRNEPFDTSTLATNFIKSLLIDSRGWLWVVTQHLGLNLFLPSTEGFRRFAYKDYPDIGHDNILSVAEDRQGRLWLATAAGLSSLTVEGDDPATARMHFQFCGLPVSSGGEYGAKPGRLFVDASGQLWAARSDSLLLLSIDGTCPQVTKAWHVLHTPGLEQGEITSFCQDASGRVWIAGSHGVSLYDRATDRFVSLPVRLPELKKGIGDDYVSDLYAGSGDRIWIGTSSSGLFLLQHNQGTGSPFDYRVNKISLGASRHSNMVLSIREDQITAGMMWIGTFAGGTYKLVPVIKNFISDFLEYPGVESPLVTAVFKDHNGTVWMGTPVGLYRYIRGTPTTCTLITTGYVSAIREDAAGHLWVAGENGIHQLRHPYEARPDVVPYTVDSMTRFVRTLYVDASGRLYAVQRLTISYYDPAADRFLPFCTAPDTTHSGQNGYALSAMLLDRNRNLWIGSTMGLSVYLSSDNAPGEQPPQCYYHKLQDTSSLRSHTIQCLIEDKRGRVWVGTSNGLSRAVMEDGHVRFRNYSAVDQIKNNLIYSVVEDPETGYLWLSTNGGLTRFDPDGLATANFDINDGLQSNEFNAGAYYRAPDGEMFFGGIQGLTSFYPNQIREDSVPPRVFITGFVIPGGGKAMDFDLAGNKTISLRSSENSFTIDFIGLHFRDPARNQYAYRLVGFQPDWTRCGNSRQVNFSQLPPGKYVFEVIASNNDGVFSTASDRLTLIINPPFYSTVWFYLLLAAVIGGILWLLHKYRLRMKLERIREIETIRKETAADFHDELGHKLTTISWFSDIIRKKIGAEQVEVRKYLDKIIETSGNMYLTMKDLLWAMDPDKDSVYHTYHQLIRFGNELFDHTGVEFNAHAPSDELREIDLPLAYKRHVLLIFKEIMHNSLKHASPQHTFLDLERVNGHLTLRFGDDGTGLPDQPADGGGHGLKNVKRRADLIHARAAFKTNGHGTVFELHLQLNKN